MIVYINSRMLYIQNSVSVGDLTVYTHIGNNSNFKKIVCDLFLANSCCVVLCYVMLCCVVLCCVVLCCVVLCCVMLCYVMLSGREVNKCVIISSGQPVGLWKPVDCPTKLMSICKKLKRGHTLPTVPLGTVTPPVLPDCPDSWRKSGLYCFKVCLQFINVHIPYHSASLL